MFNDNFDEYFEEYCNDIYHYNILSDPYADKVRTFEAPQYCTPQPFIFFLYKRGDYYMRSPSVTFSWDFVPVLRVLRDPKYSAYQDVYMLKAQEAKDIIAEFRHKAGPSIRHKMRQAVVDKALFCLNREDFQVEEKDDVTDDFTNAFNTLRLLFPSEHFEHLEKTVCDTSPVDYHGVFLRNNKTDQTY